MTNGGTTTYMEFPIYDKVTDASALFMDYRTDMSGSQSTSVIQKIDQALALRKPVLRGVIFLIESSYLGNKYWFYQDPDEQPVDVGSYCILYFLTTNTINHPQGHFPSGSFFNFFMQKGMGGTSGVLAGEIVPGSYWAYWESPTRVVLLSSALARGVSISGSENSIIVSSGSYLTTTSACVIDGKITGDSIHISTGLSVLSGSLTSIASVITGNGLTESSGSVIVNAGSGLGFSSGSVIVNAGSGLGFSSGSLIVNSPRIVDVALNGAVALTTSDKAYFRIPSTMNGWNLTSVAAMCKVASSSGSPTFTIKSGSTSMLTTNLRIDQGQTDSSTSASPAVIDTNNDNVATAAQIEVACSVSGSGVTYTVVELTFQLPT